MLAGMRIFKRPDGRYYVIASPMTDLLGDAVITTFHGSEHSRAGGVFTYLLSEMSEADIVKTRLAHGYVEIPR
jgi:hypothetical protein